MGLQQPNCLPPIASVGEAKKARKQLRSGPMSLEKLNERLGKEFWKGLELFKEMLIVIS